MTIDLVGNGRGRQLRIRGELPRGFHGEQQGEHWLCPLDAVNAAALRRETPWTAPQPLGLKKSVGCGDRLGLATPGHVRAVRKGDMAGVFAQQSIREMQRCSRSAQDVIDDATWGVLLMDYREGYGSDADHVKQIADIDVCIEAGFTGFTLDPNEHVDNAAHDDDATELQAKFESLAADDLEATPGDLRRLYLAGDVASPLDEETLLRASGKYSRAIIHVKNLARHIEGCFDGDAFDLEVSVDETDTPTSPAEHWFIASELARLGVRVDGLAPRFIGDFEKGVDYIGDLRRFEDDFAAHARIAREMGPYKLSIHTGSDKFRIYPIIHRHAGDLVHLKTAGTSWLEALRVIAMRDAPFFREILTLARERFETDRATYHISGRLERVPVDPPDDALPALFEHFDSRQALHVTFGSQLDRFRDRLYAFLHAHEGDYQAVLETHFDRHIAPFQGATGRD
ncbi:MAG: tagaturonate epimerase family protein [Anaerolineaceae bacterium]|nr:tagaturonate epimerase family protein [Anaerolineaceae bacterium]